MRLLISIVVDHVPDHVCDHVIYSAAGATTVVHHHHHGGSSGGLGGFVHPQAKPLSPPPSLPLSLPAPNPLEIKSLIERRATEDSDGGWGWALLRGT